MKLERMLYILTYLTQHKRAKAKELAQKLEVSVRTVYRDVEAIAKAGFPVVSYPGSGGGIAIMERFRLDKDVLTQREMHHILAGLKGLGSVDADANLSRLIDKLSGRIEQKHYLPASNEILIDLSPWNSHDGLGELIRKLKQAIGSRHRVCFTYNNARGKERREVEPCVIVFKDSNWYLYAFCSLREDFRLFKLRRMLHTEILEQTFEMREFFLDKVQWEMEYDNLKAIEVVAAFDESLRFWIEDMFGERAVQTLPDGRLAATFRMQDEVNVYGFLLSFGPLAEVLSPPALRNTLRGMTKAMAESYAQKP